MQNQNIQPSTQEQQTDKQKIVRLQTTIRRYQNFFNNYLDKALKCSFTLHYMQNPVVNALGHSYQKCDIQDYYMRKPKDPQTNITLTNQQLKIIVPNRALRSLIQQYKQFLKVENPQKLQLFNRDPNRMSITQYKQKQKLDIDFIQKKLDHSIRQINIQDFLKCDWKPIETIDMTLCNITSKQIQLLLSKGQTNLSNVCELVLVQNKITEIKQLKRLPRLRILHLQRNPLTKQTKQYLKRFKQQNSNIKIFY